MLCTGQRVVKKSAGFYLNLLKVNVLLLLGFFLRVFSRTKCCDSA